MTDILVLFFSIGSGFCVGKYLRDRLWDKNQFYLEVIKYTKLLIANIQSKQIELDIFNKSFCSSCNSTFCNFILSGVVPSYFNKSDSAFFTRYYGSLKDSASNKLLPTLQFDLQQLDALYHTFSIDKLKYSKIFVQLGLLCGAIIGILLL